MNNEVNENQQQSIDSSKPNFAMPDDWHGRRVDASNGNGIIHNVRLVGWDAIGQDKQPYCITDNYNWPLWVKRIRFVNTDAFPCPRERFRHES